MAAPRAVGLALLVVWVSVSTLSGAGADPGRTLVAACNQDQQPDVHFMEWDPETPPWRCWAHLGHHTYFVGKDRPLKLHAIEGRGTFVETSAVGIEVGLGVLPALEDSVQVELSLDGRTWEHLATIELPNNALGELPNEVETPNGTALGPLPDVDLPDGDILHANRYDAFGFAIEADGERFRFLRLRMPASPLQGLSGYVDASRVTLTVQPTGPVPHPKLTEGPLSLSCDEHVMERVFADHPCFFGGVNHFEAASFYHTYFVEGAVLERISGSVTTAPYRVLGGATNHAFGRIDVPVFVQVSTDGSTWTSVGVVFAFDGVPTPFELEGLGGVEADLVRLVSAAHVNWASAPGTRYHGSFLVDSNLVLEGLVPPP